MKAAWFEAFGPARQVIRIGEQPVPVPAPGSCEVLVRLHSSGVRRFSTAVGMWDKLDEPVRESSVGDAEGLEWLHRRAAAR